MSLPLESQDSVSQSEEWATESEEEGDDYHNYYGDDDPDAVHIAAGGPHSSPRPAENMVLLVSSQPTLPCALCDASCDDVSEVKVSPLQVMMEILLMRPSRVTQSTTSSPACPVRRHGTTWTHRPAKPAAPSR